MQQPALDPARFGIASSRRRLLVLLTLAGPWSCAPAAIVSDEARPSVLTDRTSYTLADNPLGFSEFLIESTFRNDSGFPVELRLCQYTPPLYWLEKRTIQGWRRVYDPVCYALGSVDPELVPPSGTRTDTLHVRHHPGAIPRFRAEALSGEYRLAYPIFLWSPSGSTRRDTVVYSNVFRLHLPRSSDVSFTPRDRHDRRMAY
jgi:hypothetical protein